MSLKIAFTFVMAGAITIFAAGSVLMELISTTTKRARWFSILSRQVLQRGDFESREDLAEKPIAFIEDYNERARPFAWTYEGRLLKIA